MLYFEKKNDFFFVGFSNIMLNMTEDNIINISLNVSDELNDMKWTEIIKRMTEQLKMMAESQPRFFGEKNLLMKKRHLRSGILFQILTNFLLYSSLPKKSSTKSMSSMNKENLLTNYIVVTLVTKNGKRQNLKKFNIKELKHALGGWTSNWGKGCLLGK